MLHILNGSTVNGGFTHHFCVWVLGVSRYPKTSKNHQLLGIFVTAGVIFFLKETTSGIAEQDFEVSHIPWVENHHG